MMPLWLTFGATFEQRIDLGNDIRIYSSIIMMPLWLTFWATFEPRVCNMMQLWLTFGATFEPRVCKMMPLWLTFGATFAQRINFGNDIRIYSPNMCRHIGVLT